MSDQQSAPTSSDSNTKKPSVIQIVDADTSESNVSTDAEQTVEGDQLSADGAASEASTEEVSKVAAEDKTQNDVEKVTAASDDTVSNDKTEAPLPNVAKKPWLTRSLSFMRRHAVVAIACSVSLLTGSGLATLFRSADAEQVVAEKPTSQKKIYVANARRHEPIQPLVPFDDLNPAIVELGKRLFHEPALSSSGRMSCASCHPLDQGGTVHSSHPIGVDGEAARYNAPTVLNAALNSAQFWDGSVATLEEQIDDPITNPHELGSSWERVVKFLKHDAYYGSAFETLLEGEPTPERVRQALVAFERSLITVNSEFDQWLAGNEKALDGDQFGGYYLFKKFNCITCHQGVGVGGTMFQKLGVAKQYFKEDISQADLGRFHFTKLERDRHVFRVPQLRNVELTAPYLHDGSVATLEEAVALMIEYQCGQEYSQEDVRRLTAFLKTLTGEFQKL